MEKEIERFDAVSDDGKRYTLICYQQYVTPPRNLSGPASRPIEGVRRWATNTGLSVNTTKDPDLFEIVQLDEIVRKV